MNRVSELRKRCVVNGKIRKGVLSRLQEILGGSRETIRKCLIGDESGKLWSFGPEKVKKIESIITLEIPLVPIKPGPKVKNNSCL